MALPTEVQQALARLKQGPVELLFDPSGVPLRVVCQDGVDLTFARGLEEATQDVVGVYDLYTSGDSITFAVNLPEWSQDALAVVFSDCATDASTYVGFGRTAGNSLRADAVPVQVRPWQDRAADDILLTIHLVIPGGDGNLTTSNSEPWGMGQEFRALPDVTKLDGQLLAKLELPLRSA